MRYPHTERIDVVDTMHGTEIRDPYRWLENQEDTAVTAWIDKQNKLAQRVLEHLPLRATFARRLEEMISIGSIGAPNVKGDRYFFIKRAGTQKQPVIYCRDGRSGAPVSLVDPNELSDDGLVSIDWWYPSHDGGLVAYGLSKEGSEQSTLHIIDVTSRVNLPDTIPRTRGCTVAWLTDGTGFFYSRFPDPGSVPHGEEDFHSRIRFHRLGTDPVGDPVVFGEGRDMEDWLSCSISDDGRYLTVHALRGTDVTELYVKDLHKDRDDFMPVAEGTDAHYVGVVAGGYLYIHTDENAPNYRLFRAPASEPARENWKQIIPEGDSKLELARTIGGRLFIAYLEDASSRLYEYDTGGGLIRRIKLPEIGTVSGIEGDWNGNECFFEFTSFLSPQTIFRYDLDTGSIDVYEEIKPPADTSPFTVRQEWYPSRDGTRIPMFVVYGKELPLDSNNPTILLGYGGFNVSITPYFLRTILPWIEMGGVFAVANLRGGGEFGERWHRAGMRENKQNVFDDFIAAAERLFSSGYTSPRRLAIMGGSNGGLLVGATITQRPDICRAAICSVPVLDMLRYHRFSIGRYWMKEYGDPDESDDFSYLVRYSPYHNVRDDTAYPAVLLTAAASDSRVDPAHAMKMAARLQAASTSGHPVLLRYYTKAGHGAGAPVTKTISDYTDYLSFLAWQLGIDAG